MKKALLVTVAAAALSLLPIAASADTFQANTYNVIGGVNVNVTSPINGGVQAGQVQLNGPQGSLLVWCLDLIDTLFVPYNYNVNTYTVGANGPGLNQLSTLDSLHIRQIASLMLNGVDNSDALSRAATQLAIWKVEYGASFTTSGLSAGLLADMNSHIALSVVGGLLDCGPGCSLHVLTDAPAVPNQTLGYASVAAVPIPAVGAGLPGLIAAFGAVFTWRKRKWLAKQKQAATA